MKPRFGALWIGLILAGAATILLIVLPGSANLYAAYAFCLIDIAMEVASIWQTDENAVASYALLVQVRWLLPISLFISIVVLVLQSVGVATLPVLWHCVVQIIPIAFTRIRIIAVHTGKHQIEQIDKDVEEQTSKLALMINALAALQQKINKLPEEHRVAPAKALKHVIDDLRYSDPMSTAAVQTQDSQIESTISLLKNSCNAENAVQFISECETLCALIQERNSVLKASKS